MWTRKSALVLAAGITAYMLSLMMNDTLLAGLGTSLIAYLILVSFTHRSLELLPMEELSSGARNFGAVRVEREISSDRIFEDGEIDVVLTIETTGGTGLVEIWDHLPDRVRIKSGENHAIINLSAGQNTIKYTLECPIMGPYTIGPLMLRKGDFSIMFFEEDRTEEYSDFIVLPRVEEIKDAGLHSRTPKLFSGTATLKQPGPGYEFYALREYRPGDSFRDINWKAYARSGELLVNAREREAISDIMIVVDSRAITESGPLKNTSRIINARTAASLASYFIKGKNSVGLTVYGDGVHMLQPSTGERHLDKILSSLATMTAGGDTGLEAAVSVVAPHIPSRSPVIIVSSLELDDSVIEGIETLQSREFPVLVVSTSTLELEIEGESVDREDYRAIKEHRSALIEFLKHEGVYVVDRPVDEPLQVSLMEVL